MNGVSLKKNETGIHPLDKAVLYKHSSFCLWINFDAGLMTFATAVKSRQFTFLDLAVT